MRAIRSILVFAFLAALCGCSDNSTTPSSSFSSSPDAAASEDARSGGIYKGVMVGSTGYFAVVLQKGIVNLRVSLDGELRNLSTTALASWTTGDPIKNALFVSGDWQATFSVGADGSKPSIVFTIPGHATIETILFKEFSTDLVRIFEGTFTGTSSGTWNFVIQGPALTGISHPTGGSSMEIVGLVNGTGIVFSSIKGGGTISGDNVSGTWENTGISESGNWTAKRTL